MLYTPVAGVKDQGPGPESGGQGWGQGKRSSYSTQEGIDGKGNIIDIYIYNIYIYICITLFDTNRV